MAMKSAKNTWSIQKSHRLLIKIGQWLSLLLSLLPTVRERVHKGNVSFVFPHPTPFVAHKKLPIGDENGL